MHTKLKLFLDWGITFDKTYEIEQRANRKVHYVDKEELAENILNEYGNKKSAEKTQPKEERETYGGMNHAPAPSQELTEQQPKTKLRP
jgi:type IV secretion system protein VirD4